MGQHAIGKKHEKTETKDWTTLRSSDIPQLMAIDSKMRSKILPFEHVFHNDSLGSLSSSLVFATLIRHQQGEADTFRFLFLDSWRQNWKHNDICSETFGVKICRNVYPLNFFLILKAGNSNDLISVKTKNSAVESLRNILDFS